MSDYDPGPFAEAPTAAKPPTGAAGVFLIIAGIIGMLFPTAVRVHERSFCEEQLLLLGEEQHQEGLRQAFRSNFADEAELEEFIADFEDLLRGVASGEETMLPFPWLIGLLVSAGMTLLGGIGMLQRAWWPVCVSGALATLVPCLGPCFGLFFPIGIWSLVVLYRADTRSGFA